MLKVKDLSVTYDNQTHALVDANMTLEVGKIYGIIGPNGAGKSTLVKGMLNLVPSRGTVTFNGKPIKKEIKRIAYVEQKSNIDMTFPISVFQCVLLGTYPSLGLFKRPGKKEKEDAMNALKKVGMTAFKDRQIGTLSGGQFQRVLIARTLAQHADLVILDEPFVGIDMQSENTIITLLKEMAKSGVTILIVHHDLSKVRKYFDGIILVNKTIVAAGDIDDVFTEESLTKAYGEDLARTLGGEKR